MASRWSLQRMGEPHDPRSCAFLVCLGPACAASRPGCTPLAAADREDQPAIAPGPFKPTADRSRPTSIRTGSATRSWASGPTGARRRCPCSATGTRGSCTSKGQPQYKDHLEHYGHPSKVGYKDIIPLWKAEKWDPDRLMGLYKKAGARYFVSMGVHHDNFDLWNSTHHKWNAVKMGPHRDVVGDWQKAAKKLGLRFGVSEHLGASFTWFQDSHRVGQDRSAGRRSLRRRRPEVRGPVPLRRPRPATPAGTARIPAGTASGSRGSRTWSISTSPTCSTPTAACPSATRWA